MAMRADSLPEGLCLIYAHGDIPGGLAWKSRDRSIESIAGAEDGGWIIHPSFTRDHWGDALVVIPRDIAEASTDTKVRQWGAARFQNPSKETRA